MPALKPKEVAPSIASCIPEYVVEVYNDLIRKNFNGHSAQVKLEDAKQAVSRAVVQQNPEFELSVARSFAEENRYWDIEPIFEDAGWKVEFNKKCIGDNFDSHYVFSIRR